MLLLLYPYSFIIICVILDLGDSMDNKLITEIIYGDSALYSINKSNLNKNNIIKFDAMFSIADLSNIDNYEIHLSKKIYLEDVIYSFKSEMNKVDNSIANHHKIRIWCSHKENNSYLLFLFICNYLKNKDCEIYVVYSEEYKEECYSPSCMTSEELEKLSKLEHLLTSKDIINFSNEWLKIKEINSEMRILENGKVKSVSYDYFDKTILEKLKKIEPTKESHLIGSLMADYNTGVTIFIYLVNRLIEINKIEILETDEDCTLNNTIIKIAE